MLHLEDFVGHLLLGVGALPLVVDVDLADVVAAEHVRLGQRERHDADRDDHQDAQHAPAAMAERPAQHVAVAALQAGITPFSLRTAGGVFMRAESIGIRLTATSHDASSETQIVIAIWPM
jgi:hypothetical protein